MIIRCLLRLALSYFYFPLRHHDVKSRLEFLFNNDKEWCAFVIRNFVFRIVYTDLLYVLRHVSLFC